MIYNYQGILPKKLNNCNFGLWILKSKTNLAKASPLNFKTFFTINVGYVATKTDFSVYNVGLLVEVVT